MADDHAEWIVTFHPAFASEFRAFDREVRRQAGLVIDVLRTHGPALGRPQVDALKGSVHPNMKELRVAVADDWYRFAFAFDPQRQAVVLCGGGKGGVSQAKFYRALIAKADERFDDWLGSHKEGE